MPNGWSADLPPVCGNGNMSFVVLTVRFNEPLEKTRIFGPGGSPAVFELTIFVQKGLEFIVAGIAPGVAIPDVDGRSIQFFVKVTSAESFSAIHYLVSSDTLYC